MTPRQKLLLRELTPDGKECLITLHRAGESDEADMLLEDTIAARLGAAAVTLEMLGLVTIQSGEYTGAPGVEADYIELTEEGTALIPFLLAEQN